MAPTTEYSVEKVAAHHVEETLGHGAIIEAKQAADDEHSQTLWQAIKSNRTAIGWSVMVSMSVVMEGYDTILIGNFYGYPMFKKKYGHWAGAKDGYQISAPWQTGLGMASTVGAIFGMSGVSAIGRYGYAHRPGGSTALTWTNSSTFRWYYERPALCEIRLSMGHDNCAVFHGCLHLYRFLCPKSCDACTLSETYQEPSFFFPEQEIPFLTMRSSWSVKFCVDFPGEYLPQLDPHTLLRSLPSIYAATLLPT